MPDPDRRMLREQWLQANQRALAAHIERVRRRLTGRGDDVAPPVAPRVAPPSTVDTLASAFGLSPFERDLVLLCAGMELDSRFPALCAGAHSDPNRPFPTFGLALALLEEPHWSALSPDSPLRYRRLIELGNGHNLAQSPLRLAERVLHYLAGVACAEERLRYLIEPLETAVQIPNTHRAAVDRVLQHWGQPLRRARLAHLYGRPAETRHVAAAVCHELKLKLAAIAAETLPVGESETDNLIRLWEREAILLGSALLIDASRLDLGDRSRLLAVLRVTEQLETAAFLVAYDRLPLRRPCLSVGVPGVPTEEQRHLWRAALAPEEAALAPQIDRLVGQFRLPAASIWEVCEEVKRERPAAEVAELGRALWSECRNRARAHMEDLAQRIESRVEWQDLVLPETQFQILRDIAAHVRQRATVYERWGFGARGDRGLGISALFSGVSGTGKTLAAEVLANELELDLYRIDLSQVVSKYIGETEKNLRRVFDAAEEGGAILLFDEADALFGKRSEVKDSHDRYANIEVGYLLQRMECYQGLAILTTNLKGNLDVAFMRRLRFVIQFPFPGVAERRRIWQRVFPAGAPTQQLDLNRLAQLNLAGGNIRNVAVNAAFLAADAGEPIMMRHLLRAVKGEYAKMERTLTDAELTGWEQ